MKIKVCGMRDKANIIALAKLAPDFMGFIFYPPSPRYVSSELQGLVLPPKIKKTGVFVNESFENIQEVVVNWNLDAVQLHGAETPLFCQRLKDLDLTVFKAFALDETSDFNGLNEYETKVDYFLFDSKSSAYGGTGKSFDWSLLQKYSGNTPFFIAGGVSAHNIEELLELKHEKFAGVDLNSKFEISPALKDIYALESVFIKIRK